MTEGLQVPFELVLANIMATISTAVQGKFIVHVREGYTEPLNTYWIAPLPPSELKSPTMKLCKAPLEDYERVQNAKESLEIKRLQSEQATLAKTIEYKRAQAVKANDDSKRHLLLEEIQGLETQVKDIPTYTRLLVDDATPEALGQLMAQHDGKIAHLEAEAALLDNISGRYSHGKPNLDVLLKGYSVETIRIDRRGSEPVHISQPHITLCVTPQPYALQSRGASEAFRGRGLDARCLFLLPKSAVGSRNMEPSPIQALEKQAYHDHITTLLEIEQKHTDSGQLDPYILQLDTNAYSQWLEFACAVEKALGIGGELALMQDWGGKIRGNVVRLAGLLHCAQHHRPQDAQISGETMANACYLGTILIAHAKATYGLMGEDLSVRMAKHVLHWIQSTHQEVFSVRDCLIALRSTLKTSEATQAALDDLETRDYIFKKESPQRQSAGRPPSPRYMVNPLTHQKT